METTEIIATAAIALLLNYAIIAYAVHNSTAVMRQQSKIQTALLSEMAKKAGVTEAEIQEVLNIK